MPRTPKMSAKERKREKKRQMMARESIAAFFTATAAIIGHAAARAHQIEHSLPSHWHVLPRYAKLHDA